MKHLTMLWAHGMRAMPSCLAELGPGDSFGVGLAAMLSGVNSYWALDAFAYSNYRANLRMLDELLQLFRSHSRPPTKGWPNYDQYLNANGFPGYLLTGETLSRSQTDQRIAMIREALMSPHHQELPVKIEYLVPWSKEKTIPPGTMDVILSHSVLEHVVDLPATYRAFHSWLKPGGYCTHQIDFTSHDSATEWNRHWAYPPGLWRIILGRRRYFINRSPGSVHLSLLQEHGFRITCCLKRHRYDGIQRQQLSANWRQLSDDDLTCSGLFVQAQRSRINRRQ